MANTKTINRKNYAKQKTSAAVIITAIVGAIILIGLIALSVVSKSGVFNEKKIALKVGDKEVNAIEYVYYYTSVVNNWTSSYESYLSLLGYDSSKSPKAQTTQFSGQDWDDFFANMTNESITEVKILASEAKKNGFQADQDAINEAIESTRSYLELSANYYGYSLDSFITLMFNNTKGMTMDKIAEYVSESELASQYSQSISDSIEITDSEIADYISENKADFSSVSYRMYDYTFNTETEGSKDSAKAQAEAHIAEGTTETFFEKYAHNIVNNDEDEKNDVEEADDITLTEYTSASYISNEDLLTWLMDDARQEGDTTVIESSSKYTAVYFVKVSLNDYKLRSVRHILIKADEGSDGNISDEAYEKAKATAQEILDQYNNGEKTEESFATLATEKSEDSGSKDNGGLYENVTKGEMVETFNDWLFDETRQVGDTGLVKSEYGYHVMYYVGEGEKYCDATAKNTIKSNKYNDIFKGIKEGYTVTTIDDVINSASY